MNLRLRMVVLVTVVTSVALGSAFAAVAYAFNSMQRTQLDQALVALAWDEAEKLPSNGFSFSDGPGPRANSVELRKHGVVFDAKGRALARTELFHRSLPPLHTFSRHQGVPFDFEEDGRPFRGVVVPIASTDKWVLLASSREDLDGDEFFLFRAMLVSFIASVAWAGGVASWVSLKLTQDHRRIAATARRVAAGDLEARVNLHSRDPETGQLGADVDLMIESLGIALTNQQRFLAHAAHELRSPLTKLYGELQQALRKSRDSEGYRYAITEALEATRRLKVLAEQLLSLVRATKSPPGTGDAVSVESVVRGAVELCAEVAKERNVHLELQGQDALVLGSSEDLSRMLRNVLENALQHSPEGGRVLVQWTAQEILRLTVHDQGEGVAPEHRERIFEPFFRINRSRKHGLGAGLGLSIAREIASAHGGKVELSSDSAGPGATFQIELPLCTHTNTGHLSGGNPTRR